MMYLKWLGYLFVHLLIVIARYPIAPFAVVFFTTNDRRELLFPFRWLGTIDNGLDGDSGWRNEHITGDPLSTWNRTKWLWRNGGNALNYNLLGVDNDKWFALENWMIQDINRLWVRKDKAWMYRAYLPLFGRYLNLFIGWSLFGAIEEKCKFTCTIRIKKNRPA